MGKGKMREPARDKRLKPTGDKTLDAMVGLSELSAEVQAALELLDAEAADAIIEAAGGPDAEYGALVRGVRAAMGMHWAAAKWHGMRESQGSLRHGAQTLTILLALVHYAYALGVRRGRGC